MRLFQSLLAHTRRSERPFAFCALALFALLSVPTGLNAQDSAAAPPVPELQLGEVSFANSGSAAAQDAFERGLLLLHSFEYRPAAEAFRRAQEIDPDFGMAYWGEAMTYNHPIWMEQDRAAALAALRRFAPTPEERVKQAGPAGGGTEREAAYMRAVNILYGSGDKEARDFAYAEAMAALRRAYPEDEDAAAFYALAFLGTAHEGRDFGTYMRAAGVLEQVFHEYPRHPGIAHYLIHSYDDSVHAPLGIRAARNYSKIAPDAPHAQHMTSHIFLALGMWDDVVEANENAMRVVNERQAREGLPPVTCGHYNFWLEYGYLQQGRNDDALGLVRECYESVSQATESDAPMPHGPSLDYFTRMVSRYVIDAGAPGSFVGEAGAEPRGFDAAASAVGAPLLWPIDLSDAVDARITHAFAEGYAAAEQGDAKALRTALGKLEAAAAEAAAVEELAGPSSPTRVEVLETELRALRHWLQGETTAAIELARQAGETEAAMPLAFGPPEVDKPAHELLGELLLAAGKRAEAREAFAAALKRAPGRAAALAGAQAASASP